MGKGKEIGFVSSIVSMPANDNHFSFIIKKDNNKECFRINQFDLVKVKREQYPDDPPLFGIVESVSSFCDAPDHVANFVSSNFGQESIGSIDRIGFYCVLTRVLLNKNGDYFPVKTGDKVFTCTEEEVYKALYSDYEEQKYDFFPIAFQKMYRGNKKGQLELYAYLKKSYLLGPDAAHLNISGMSGVASKTTKVLTILRELYYHTDDLHTDDLSIIIFNTKDKDLLDLNENDNSLKQEFYKKKTASNHSQNNWNKKLIVLRPNFAEEEGYYLDFSTQKKLGNLDLLVAMDDDSGTMDSCVKSAQADKLITSWDELNNANLKINPYSTQDNNHIHSQTQSKFKRLLQRVIDNSSIFISSREAPYDITKLVGEQLDNGRVIVVDIATLSPLQQAVVFGCVLRTAQSYRRNSNSKKKVALFIDEVNRYASSDTPSQAPILQNLIDIAETGRSIGLCLVTAEQSMSVIHRRIKANFANMIFGKTGALELSQPDYMMIPDSYKQRIASFRHADALVSTSNLNTGLIHAEFPDKFY